jgi:hypothetical protein
VPGRELRVERGAERRGVERIHLDTDALIIDAAGSSSPVRVRDLSSTGIGVRDHAGLAIGAAVHVLLFGASLPCVVEWTADTAAGSTAGLRFQALDRRAEATVLAVIGDVRRADQHRADQHRADHSPD